MATTATPKASIPPTSMASSCLTPRQPSLNSINDTTQTAQVAGTSVAQSASTTSEGFNIPPSPFGTPFVTNQTVNYPTAAKPPTGIVKVGFYEVEGTIGRGNFAVVKIAKHRITRTDVSFFFKK